MAGQTFTTSSTGVYLYAATSNPVSIAAGVSLIGGSGNYGYGLAGAATVDWTITNSGTIRASTLPFSYGIVLLGTLGATITNTGSGRIDGYKAGVTVTGAGNVLNQGTIDARGTAGGAAGANAAGAYSVLTGGVVLGSGGISNAASAVITGYFVGAGLNNGGTVANAGTISASASAGSYGVLLADGGLVTNVTGGTISGGQFGIFDLGAAASVSNQGVINGTTGIGAALSAPGSVTNQTGGTITGGTYGVRGAVAGVTVSNHGVINGTYGAGVYLSGGSVSNAAGGTITGGKYGIRGATSPVAVTNQGSIDGVTAFGINLGAGGNINNLAGGTITGESAGVDLTAGGTITNTLSGLISGGVYGIYTGGNAGSTIVNAGTVTGAAQIGARMAAGGFVTNNQSGTVSGLTAGIYIYGASSTVVNAGHILSTQTTAGLGVLFADGGFLTNAATGTIASAGVAVGFGEQTASVTGSVSNLGLITAGNAASGFGVTLFGANALYNAPSGTINAGYDAVYAAGTGPSTVTNSGHLNGTFAAGVWLGSGGSLTNAVSGTIAGGHFGVELQKNPGTVVNAGSISSYATASAAGVQVAAGGNVTNVAGGRISGEYIGVQIGAFGTVSTGGTVFNQGSIYASNGSNVGAGVWIHGPGSIYNGPSGVISGGPFGIVEYYQTTVVNFGSIGGTQWSIYPAHGGFTNRVVVEPGSVFSGTVSGGNAIGATVVSTLELAATTASVVPNRITGIGTQFIDFGQIEVDAQANWSLAGTVVAGQTIAFGGANASLTLLTPRTDAGTVANFITTDTLVLSGITDVTGLSFNDNLLSVNESGGPAVSLLFAAPTALAFSVVNGSTDITVACFARGTRIQTETGAVAVETLRPGAAVVSFFGGSREIVWVGHRHIDCTRHPRPRTVWPIQIEAGAFGPGLPAADLRVSPDHAVYVNEVLIPARHLVNGTSIRQIPVDEVTYYHVELPRHDVLLAEGLPTESYLDIGDRSNFSGSMPIGLFPDFSTPVANLAAFWEAEGCAPLVIHGEQLEAARALVNQFAQAA
jgi:Hint domain